MCRTIFISVLKTWLWTLFYPLCIVKQRVWILKCEKKFDIVLMRFRQRLKIIRKHWAPCIVLEYFVPYLLVVEAPRRLCVCPWRPHQRSSVFSAPGESPLVPRKLASTSHLILQIAGGENTQRVPSVKNMYLKTYVAGNGIFFGVAKL